jgi:hypothetical protein
LAPADDLAKGQIRQNNEAQIVAAAERVFAGAGYLSGGKTGTAQAVGIGAKERYNASKLEEHQRDHALYVAYAPADNPRIVANRIGWHEPYVVQITDPNQQFFDPKRRTLHILARGDVHRSNFGMLSKVVENEKGEMRFDLERTPAGTAMVFVPLPGGNIKFHVLQDPRTGLYWLLSNQVTDSMRRPGTMPESRFGLPLDQRDRLVLHYSKNLMDWVFAGLVAKGATPRESYHYCGMDIDGEDLVILSRTGDANVRQPKAPHRDAHDTNLITFHRVRNFRALVY